MKTKIRAEIRITPDQFRRLEELIFKVRNEAKRNPRSNKLESWGFKMQKIMDKIFVSIATNSPLNK